MSERRLKLRLNVSSYRRITDKNGLKDEEVCKRTGLSEKTLSWILDNQYTEGSTLERIADAVGCTPDEIALPDTMRNTENVIEWLRDQEQATLTLTQQRTITSVKKLADKHPEECRIVSENKDGSICAHVPVRWITVRPPRQLSEETKRIMTERLQKSKA
jgi:transcriptional regulator with XRE-family HTH domain